MSNDWTAPEIFGLCTHTTDEVLFKRLGIAIKTIASANTWILRRDDQSLESPLTLVRPDGVELAIDFTAGKARHRTRESGKGATAIAKALGIKQYHRAHHSYPTILDATGGLGQDAWTLASIGCNMIVVERHPLVHALLDDALLRASKNRESAETAARVSIVHGEGKDSLNALLPGTVHAIYLDPMYPPRRKKADSKKGMQFLHALLGPPESVESPELLLSALHAPVSRVAVKRPKGAQQLKGSEHFGGQKTVIETPNTRYDIYHVSAQPRPST